MISRDTWCQQFNVCLSIRSFQFHKGRQTKTVFFLKRRPFTLLNAFYKIRSICTSCRIRFTLDNLISETQSGNMKGRYIGANTRFIYDLIAFTESKNIPGLLVLTDFEKASNYFLDLFISVFFLCFWKIYINWVNILNKNSKTSILQFEIQRGCRQGDPIVPYLFYYVQRSWLCLSIKIST